MGEIGVSIPQPYTATPGSEKTGGDAGTDPTQFAMGNHQHPRLTATATGTLNGVGEAAITFTRSFPSKPAVALLLVEQADNQPVEFKVKSWVLSDSDYVGCVIKGYRLQGLPTIAPVSGLLTAVITGVNAIVTALSGFNITSGNASGAEYSFIALQQSAPA